MLFKDRNHKWVYAFAEGDASMKALLGGKGANIAEMTRAELPVPPGFTITTEACNAYIDYDNQFPEGMWTQAKNALEQVEIEAGKVFGDLQNPLLVSVRSGAATSMPGMMDTVLNLGLNDETVNSLADLTKNPRFAYDAYRRFIAMFGHIVMDVPNEKFDRILERHKSQTKLGRDTDLSVSQLKEIIESYKRIIFADRHGEAFPQDPYDQLRMAISAVFDSWRGRRAVEYRRVHRIPDNLGTAVNVQAMVFGNLGWESGTGVAFTRNPSTGERDIFGEYLLNAQGEDVVAGTRTPQPIDQLAKELPLVFAQLCEITRKLEANYRDMQDIEFTVEQNKLWLLQTRTGKRTGASAVRIAVEMVQEGIIDKETAVMRVEPIQLDQLLHPRVDPDVDVAILTKGLPASPGAAAGLVVFDPDEVEKMVEEGNSVILVRDETSPDDFHGMVGAAAVLTARGGMTSHAAVVARGMGKPCVVGAGELELDYEAGILRVGDCEVRRGELITLDGSTGNILLGSVPTLQPELDDDFQTIMGWADEMRTLEVRANADNGHDASIARGFGAEGIGLCRTEHMFFGEDRLALMRQMILADDRSARQVALDKLLPIQRQDFVELFQAMDGLAVTIRLLDPPLHEFLPNYEEMLMDVAELKLQLLQAKSLAEVDGMLRQIGEKEELLHQIARLRESNPMLGHRGCRLGLVYPEVTEMQIRAIMEAACLAQEAGCTVHPEIMIPLVSLETELAQQRALAASIAEEVVREYGASVDYSIGTMIELPRAALTADKIAKHADFFSFGTNDLTQTTFGLSRDDSGRFLSSYIHDKILTDDPFQVLDQEGVGQLLEIGLQRGRATKPDLKIGICGEHGGESRSVEFCHRIGIDYISCSPFRVPLARLAAAQAALKNRPAPKAVSTPENNVTYAPASA